jgi:hypothetical protein
LIPPVRDLHLTSPDWLPDFVAWDRVYAGDEQRMPLAVGLSRENVRRETGGPFGAAVFVSDSGRVIAAGPSATPEGDRCDGFFR